MTISNFRFGKLLKGAKKVLTSDVGDLAKGLAKRSKRGLMATKGKGVTTSASAIKDKLAKKAMDRKMQAGAAIAKKAKSGRNPFEGTGDIKKRLGM